jgi:hypothetical protein
MVSYDDAESFGVYDLMIIESHPPNSVLQPQRVSISTRLV